MKHVLGYAAKVIFYLFAATILIWTGSLTVSFVGRVLPGSMIEPFLALGVFDVGAAAWLLVFLFTAAGLGQRAVALLMMTLDLIGVGLMTISELFMGGQELAVIPAGLGTVAIWVIGAVTFSNVAAAYLYHVVDQQAHQEITKGVALDRIKARSIKVLESKLDTMGAEIAEELGEDMKRRALLELGLEDRPAKPALPESIEAGGQTIPAGVGGQPIILEGVKVTSPNGGRPAMQ